MASAHVDPLNGRVNFGSLIVIGEGDRYYYPSGTGSYRRFICRCEWMKFLPVLLLLSTSALAEPPPGTDPNSSVAKWFHDLHDEIGQSCCGIGDCRAVVAKSQDGHWWVKFGEVFITVPDRIVLHRDDNPTGHSVLCASPVQPESIMYCFIPETGA